MTGKPFRQQVYITIALLIVAAGCSLAVGICYAELAEASRAAIPVYIAVSAGWLTFCLQRRVAYTNALRGLWERIVGSVSKAIQYTYALEPREAEFNSLLLELACRIDELRGVFRNVGEVYCPPSTEAKRFVYGVKHAPSFEDLENLLKRQKLDDGLRGLYPFESLKQIRTVIFRLGYGEKFSEAKAGVARQVVESLWRNMRAELLKELDRDYPEFPDTPYMHIKKKPRPQPGVGKT